MRRAIAPQQSIAREALQDAAEIAGIQAELAADIRGSQRRPVRQFVEHARLGQGEPAVMQPLAQCADGAGVEPAEPPDGGDAVGEGGLLRHACYSQVFRWLSQLPRRLPVQVGSREKNHNFNEVIGYWYLLDPGLRGNSPSL